MTYTEADHQGAMEMLIIYGQWQYMAVLNANTRS